MHFALDRDICLGIIDEASHGTERTGFRSLAAQQSYRLRHEWIENTKYFRRRSIRRFKIETADRSFYGEWCVHIPGRYNLRESILAWQLSDMSDGSDRHKPDEPVSSYGRCAHICGVELAGSGCTELSNEAISCLV